MKILTTFVFLPVYLRALPVQGVHPVYTNPVTPTGTERESVRDPLGERGRETQRKNLGERERERERGGWTEGLFFFCSRLN
jgi:hypothetical protein